MHETKSFCISKNAVWEAWLRVRANQGAAGVDEESIARFLVSTSDSGVGLVSEQVGSGQAAIVFDGPHDVERWEVRGRRGDVEVEYFDFLPVEEQSESKESTASGAMSERFVILSIVRGSATETMHVGRKHRAGDVAAVAIHIPERDDALRELASKGWVPSRAESEPSNVEAVEEVGLG